uniref:Electron transfer flavoprotein-ubiquinone oxidoreductase n=1 Tax=Arundo donax TaxID=35708 RepID=A0A0A9HJ42_ARUDO
MHRALRAAAAAAGRALSSAGASPLPRHCPRAPAAGVRWLCGGGGHVVIVGAWPAGLTAVIRLKQLCRAAGNDLSVCVLEKGSEVGAHVLSGNVFEPRALDELIPKWRQEDDMDTPIRIQRHADTKNSKNKDMLIRRV